MKRIVSWVLTVMMIIGMLGSFSISASAAIDTSNPILITQWHDQSGTINDGFGVLVPSGTAGEFVEFIWQDAYYKAEVGVDAFTSVDAAISAGKRQLIVPATEIGTVNITGSIELYGNHFGKNPNSVPTDKTEDWTLSDDWSSYKSVVTGNINIASKASPLSSKGTQIVIDGIELKGFFVDNIRPVSKYATDITLKNMLFTFNKATSSSHHVIDLETEHARSDDASVLNLDSFVVESSRFDFATSNGSTRIMDEDSPKTVIVRNNYFAQNFARIGWFKQRASVSEGYLEVSGNYFNRGGYIIHLCGGAGYFDAKLAGTNSVAKFNNNIVINSSVSGPVVITPGLFASTEVNGNIFVDTQMLQLHAITAYASGVDSPAGVDYSDVLSINGNRFVGVSNHILLNDGTKKLSENNHNYYAVYTDDYSQSANGETVYGAAADNDYYLDFNATTLASDMEMVVTREGMTVNTSAKTASIIIAGGTQTVPALKTKSGADFKCYTDKECKTEAEDLLISGTYYAKATNQHGVSVVYTLYVSTGNASAPEYEGAYLLYDKCADMPVGTKFSAVYKGTEYMFTAGVNAFASLSQISVQNALDGGEDEIDVIMLEGTYQGGEKVTGTFNIVGDNTVLANDFVTDAPIKIACVGDSLTEAVIDSKRATWGYPVRLEEMLNAAYGQGEYEVKNFGKGNSALQQINTTTDTGINANRSQYTQGSWYYSALDYNPDVVLVLIGHNDTQVSAADHIYKSAANYKKHYAELIESFKALPSNPQVVIVSCHSRSDTFRKKLVENCIIPVQKELAEEYNTLFIDTYTATDGIKNAADGIYSSDNLHLTPKGYAFLAGLIKDGMDGVFAENRTVTTEGITVDTSLQLLVTRPATKVAAIGDDVTYGSKAYINYPMAMGEILGDEYEVRNYGECKATTLNYIKNTDYAGISDYESVLEWDPDFAIIGFGVNNSANTAFVNNYKTIIEALQAKGTTVILTTSLKNTVNEKIKELAAEYELMVVDVYTEAQSWTSDCKQSTTLLTEKGNQKLAAFLTKQIWNISAAEATEQAPVLAGEQFKDYDGPTAPVTDAPLFTERDDSSSVVKNSAVAVIREAAFKASGDSVIARWDGQYYKFTVGVNAFGTVAEAMTTTAVQVIVTSGHVGKFEITRSVEIYGVNYNVNPWYAQGDKVVQNEDWGKTGDSVIAATDVVITQSATPSDQNGTTILISGFRLTRGFNDTARKLSSNKTSITLKNNILDRCVETGEFREFNLHNANNANFTDAAAVNNDEFTIKNMLFVNRTANTGHALFQEQLPSYFTIDGFGCNADMATFGFPKWGLGTKTGKMTLTNSFIKDNSDHSSRFGYVVNFSGHSGNTNLTDEQVTDLDLTLELKDNHFINCYDGGTEADVVIWPAAFTSINVDGNTFVSTADLNCRAIQWQGSATFRANDKDFTNRITYVNNRIIGSLATGYVNDLTELDLSNNYFETYTLSYRNGVTGDIPADIDANYYLDYALTTTIGDMAPTYEASIANLTTSSITRTMYGYSTGNIEGFAFASDNGVSYTVYSDADCTAEITSLDVTEGAASKAYVKAKRGNITMVYTLYVMGIKQLSDINAEMNTTLAGISEPTLWYPSLYGAPNGIEVISYYDGAPVKFTTGKNVASSVGEMGLYGDDIIFPDDILEIDGLELVTAVNVYSAVANIKGVTMRKVKIACVGDSITDGVVNNSRQYSYPTTMQNLLGTASYDIQNYGGSGATAQYMEYLRLNAAAGNRERQYRILRKSMYDGSIAYNGDVVIIGLGGNDSAIGEPVRWLSNDNFMKDYIDLIREYQSLPSKPAIYLTTTTERYDDTRAAFMVNENMQQIEQIIADMTGAKVIDLHNLMDYMFDPAGTKYSDDKLHPNATGYQEMGKIIANELTKTFAPIGENTVTISGATLSGPVSSSVASTSVAISDTAIVADAPAVKSGNIVGLALNNVVVKKDGKAVAKVDATDLVTNSSSLEIDLATADTEKTYDITINTRTLPVTVTNDDPVALLYAVQAASTENTSAECAGYAWALTVDVSTLSSDIAAAAVTTLRSGGKHVIADVAEKAPDCENGGHNAHKACVLCDYTEGFVGTNALGHTVAKVDGTAATCTADGHKEYFKCTVCQKLFADEALSVEIADIEAWKKADGKIAATGHTWGEYVYNNDATKDADGTKTAKCQNCDATDTVTAEGTKITVTIIDSSKKFTDVKATAWYKKAVDHAVSYGLISGITDTTFEPNTKVTRAMFVTILARMAGVDTGKEANKAATTPFTDVKSGKYYSAAVAWGAQTEIVAGTSKTTFDPDADVTRQQLCALIVRYAEHFGVELAAVTEKVEFTDADKIQKYARSAVEICQKAGIVSGYKDGSFKPFGSATRAEAAQMLYVFHKNFVLAN